MDVQTYLNRIKYPKKPQVDLKTLKGLQSQHLLTVPYENLDVILQKQLILDINVLYKKIVVQERGGWCHELNAIFCWLLQEIGFQAEMMSGQGYLQGQITLPYSHMGILVTLDKSKYYVDVGWGDLRSCIVPMKLDEGVSVTMASGTYMMKEKFDDAEDPDIPFWYLYFICSDDPDKDNWQKMLRFKLRACTLDEFDYACKYYQSDEGGDVLPYLPLIVLKTHGGSAAKLLIGNKFRHYQGINSLGKKSIDNEDNLTLDKAKGILMNKFELDINTRKFNAGWDGNKPGMENSI